MDTKEAWKIVKDNSHLDELTEDETILLEEALNFILFTAIERSGIAHSDWWNADIEAGAYNLANHYEKIERYDLAIKYYSISKEYGCSYADEGVERAKEKSTGWKG